MSLENIIKYATNTPANTNPAVMSSVINSSFKETKEEILNEAMPKVIDLDKYGLSDIILNLYAAGGGAFELKGYADFWEEVRERQPDVIHFTLEPFNAIFKNSAPVICISTRTGEVMTIAAEALVLYFPTVMRISIMMFNGGSGDLTLFVKVETVISLESES